MAKQCIVFSTAVLLLLLCNNLLIVAGTDDVLSNDGEIPLNDAAEEVDDKKREERSIFGFGGSKSEPVVQPVKAYSTYSSSSYGSGVPMAPLGYGNSGNSGIKTSSYSVKTSSYGGGAGYGSPGYGSAGYGSAGYGSPGYGGAGYGSKPGYGSQSLSYPYDTGHGSSSGGSSGGYYGTASYGVKTSGPISNNNLNAPSDSKPGLFSRTLNYLGFAKGSATQKTQDFLLNARQQLPSLGNCGAYQLPANVNYKCQGNQCDVTCSGRYSFPDGKTTIKMVCMGGQWILRDSEYTSVPPCQAVCLPPCQNNGICLEAGVCKCPENYSGPLCQFKKSVCAVKPPVPKNSKVSCKNNFCDAECLQGFQFPDGSTIANIQCQDGQWVHTKSGMTKPPDCAPICKTPCANGGRCISYNVCECSKMYRGDHCQHNINACNVTKTDFNGNYKCAYDNTEAKCLFSCPEVPGLKIKGSIDIEYKCNYATGEFYPLPLPMCIYPPGYTIREGSKSAQYTKQESVIRGGGSSSYGKQYETEYEKYLAIIAKYKDYDRRSEWYSSDESSVISNSYSLYVTGDMNLVIDRTPKPAMCTTWGGINVKTFDGLVYKAPLSCSHTLITDEKDATFDIVLKACPYGSGYGCAHTLKIYWQQIVYTFENTNGTVQLSTPTKKLPIPVQVMGMKVLPVAQHLQIDLESIGLKIDWDRHQYVALHAGPALWSRVGGLCGTLDGDYSNDLVSKRGVALETVKAFADAWRVDDKSELCTMDNSAELEFGSDSCDPAKRKKALDICERLLTNEKLQDCIKPFNFEALLRTCVDDYCNCPNREVPATCNCDSIAMLAKECTFRGVKMEHGWRNMEICPITCSPGRVYLPCGPDMEPTCDSAVVPTKGKCNEGCFCPEGTVQYKDACITSELCPCTMRGREYKPEDTIKKQCNTCTCKDGKWKCTDEKCSARCGAIGDPHYQTFDGKRYDFMGKCSYHLLKTPRLSVEAENVACSGAISENMNFAVTVENPSCTKSVTLRFTIKDGVPTTVHLGQGLVTKINDKEVLKFPKMLGNGEVLIRQASSTFMTVDFPDGIRVWWDGVSRVYIDAPPSYRDKTAGLCGTFNSNTQDDFLTPEGDVETAVEPFADKWRTKDTCDFLAESKEGPHPCTVNPEKREMAEKYCAWILGDLFQDCHWTVEPEQFYEDCLYDVCACKDEPSKCFCPILSAYGTECMRQGIKTGWRLAVKECAVKCPVGQVFDECGDSCQRSCDDLVTRLTCKKECVEGCRCPHGEYLNENNECVPQKHCHCTFDGITFKPGYKEVRPGSKFLDLCTCIDGIWECEDAEPGDKDKYPPSSELRAECANKPFAEFSKCVPKEPKTCKNMHEYVEDLEDCAPGCACMSGYVYDTSRKACVQPENCSCHHGSKSYNDGEQMKEDCNVCICQSGNWKCSSNGCESTCSVWGDSHFTTYDNHDFDFQGACDYILSKGVADNGDSFSITIQNVLCGTMGVTCSKSVEIAISTLGVGDTITLTTDSTYLADPSKSAINKLREAVNSKAHGSFHIYKAGVFIVIEVIPLKLQVKWDEGTRVYVKLGNEWKHKVNGLCGNYNDDAMDDMQTPSKGLETSPSIFGHAWKKQQFCAAPTQPIDACKEHPERETWAQLKCGVLKSSMFEECHSEVPVEKYLKRCIFDTCACDQGGDCECLCTAIAAYAHSCSQKGISIRWRTPHFCPMQCDPHCADYKSCTPACAVETCDNFLDQGLPDRMCNKENCLEGCQIKPCEDGLIYLNDSYKECVPKSECKPVCMLVDGKTYYEGDITYTDDCATCRCSKKKEICSGVTCPEQETTEQSMKLIDETTHGTTQEPEYGTTYGTTQPPMGTEKQTKCVRGWTRWFDKDSDPSTSVLRVNDEEQLPRYDRLESIYGTCQKQYMKKIECRVVNTHESSDAMDENVICDLNQGLGCVGKCHDYELRVFCQCEEEPEEIVPLTEKPATGEKCDGIMAEYKEYPADCHKFLHCQPKDVSGDWIYVEKTCGEYMMFNPTNNICDHIAVVKQLKPVCGEPLVVEKEKKCPMGQVMSDCANQCEKTCHFYGMILEKRGLCQRGEHCRPGCVDANLPDCYKLGKYWRDEKTCVEADECPCMDKQENYVQPHKPVVGEWEICQCIGNAYSCVPNQAVETTRKPMHWLTTPEDESGRIIDVTHFPTSVTPPLQCDPKNLIPMIQGDDPLPDSIFNASTSLGLAFTPEKARLFDAQDAPKASWSPLINDQMQYLEVNFPEQEPLFGIITQGSPTIDNYVTLFKILYSHDGLAYHYLYDDKDQVQMFSGALDSRTKMTTLFKLPIEAKSVRIYPLKWHGSIAMRVELLGCGIHEVTTTIVAETEGTSAATTKTWEKEYFTTEPSFEFEDADKCIDKMGINNGQLDESQVKASSIWHLPKPARKPRLIDLLKLSSPVGWRPVANTPNEYVEIDFHEPRNISGITTKGGPDGWVTAYKVLFSKNKIIWNKVPDSQGNPMVFPGNNDADTEKTNYFKTPILTQYLKVVPDKWEKNINMRLEPLGCFEPYLEIKTQKPLETIQTKCLICEGIVDPTANDKECKCKGELFWDGKACVQSNMCPCVDSYVPYPIGSKYENTACEECVCVLGGHANCKPKKCPPCGDGLRPVVSAGCFCKCEPCPKHQKLCKSSGDCIPEILWCNGVQDCADDEDATCSDKIEIVPQQNKQENETVIITCPKPECPPQTTIKIMEKKSRKMSSMFSSTFTKKVTMLDDGQKITKTKVITSTEEFLPMPGEDIELVQEEECAEFACIPIPSKVVKKNETITCSQPKCPENYDIELDMSNAKPGDCSKYTCVLRPKKDDTCEISGKSFTTFDGTEFKYDTCSHILARDIVDSKWVISVNLQCEDDARKICRKMITIKDIESAAMLTIMPNMKLIFNGFEYTVQQLINSPICKASFVISQPGNTVLVVSRKHGFWVLYDDIGYIKVGISSKYIKTVDGLCGYYNGIPADDKRAPDGTVLTSTAKFGDSWFDKKIPKEECYPQVCPLDIQKKALSLCNIIKHKTFLKCGKSVNYKQFVSKCMETTCECLKVNKGDAKACKCNILQDFVKKCLSVNPNIELNTWRAVHECEISCPAPLIHSDCYKRRCEPSCDTLNSDDCPIINDACFSGCYCPEGTVRKGENCVPIAECKDCVCNSFGTSKYFTYDRKSFSFNGNCTYLLSRDILLPGVHTFQVYVTMDDCKKLGHPSAAEHTSCAKSLHMLNGDHVIHIQRPLGNQRTLQVFVDGVEVKKFPHSDDVVELREVNGKELTLLLPELNVELTSSFDDLTFSLGVPSVKYGNKMEGLCGDCNGNPNDDLRENPAKKKGRKPSTELVDVIQSWQADEPKLGLDPNECLSEDVPKDECLPLPPEKDPCMLMYKEELFGKCIMIIDPLAYVSSCQEDLCKPGSDQRGACDSLSAYAKECASQGICLNWRSADLCPYDCPKDMIYNACGCAKTCESIKRLTEFEAVNMKTNSTVQTLKADSMCTVDERFEGCFCPKGKVMDEGKCIPEKQCIKCDDEEHLPGDKWQKDKCTECACDDEGKIECFQKECTVEENICAEGYKPQKIVSDEQCCPRYACVPEPKLPPSVVCLEPLMPTCGPGQYKKQKTGSDGCPQYICECKPKEECEPLVAPTKLKPGEKVVTEDAGCCPTQKIVCDKTKCPKAPTSCSEEFYEVTSKMEPNDCCETYVCEPPPNVCIVQYGEAPKFLKKISDKWVHPNDPCKQELCTHGPNGSTQVITTTEQCDMACGNGFTYMNEETTQCCGKCVQTECEYEGKLYRPNDNWKSADNCTTFFCTPKDDMLIVTSMKEACPDISDCAKHLIVDEGGCCKKCKVEPVIESLKNCLPMSLAPGETVKLVRVKKPGHGNCVNVEAIKGFTECAGTCNSGSKYNPVTFSQDKICNCCNIIEHKIISVKLLCDDGLEISKDIEIPSSCGCLPCKDSVGYHLDDSIDVRMVGSDMILPEAV